jgi:hypothetical protein
MFIWKLFFSNNEERNFIFQMAACADTFLSVCRGVQFHCLHSNRLLNFSAVIVSTSCALPRSPIMMSLVDSLMTTMLGFSFESVSVGSSADSCRDRPSVDILSFLPYQVFGRKFKEFSKILKNKVQND